MIYEDREMIAIHKPSGLLVHRTALDRNETKFALQILRDQTGGAHLYPVHRLDKPTSGVLVFAKSPEMASALAQQFQDQLVHKTYLAVVRGTPPERVTIDYPVSREEGGPSAAQEALTTVERLATVELPFQVDRFPTARYSLVKASPKTGRQHQIRRHLRHIGSPVIGDVNHGVGKHNRFFREHFGSRRLLLACTELRLSHPATGSAVVIGAPLASDMQAVVSRLGWHEHL